MRKLGLAALCVIGLCGAGEPPPIDLSAIGAANVARDKLAQECEGRSFKTSAAATECDLSADMAFATVSKIRDPGLFSAYARTRKKIAIDLDTGNTGTAAVTDSWRAWWRYLDRVFAQQDAYMARQAKLAKGPAFDKTALSAAHARQAAAIRVCLQPDPNVWNSSRYACLLPAARDFAIAIKMRDMRRFDSFEIRVRLGMWDMDHEGLRPFEMQERYEELYNQLFKVTGDYYFRY